MIECKPYVTANDIILFSKYLYIPKNDFLLDLYKLTFGNIIHDYDMFLEFYKSYIYKQEINRSAYKFGEIINSSYLTLNHFLIQLYYILNNTKNSKTKITNTDLNQLFGTYEVGKQAGRDSWGNKNTYLLNKIGDFLNIDLTNEIKEVKYIEILCRNYFSHGWHLLFINLFIMNAKRLNNYTLQYNKDYNMQEDSGIIFLKNTNFNINQDMQDLEKTLLGLNKPFTRTDDLTFFLHNYNNYYYLKGNDFILNTGCSRIFLKRYFFNKYCFLSEDDKNNNIENIYVNLVEIISNDEKLINIESVLNLISSIVKKIDLNLPSIY